MRRGIGLLGLLVVVLVAGGCGSVAERRAAAPATEGEELVVLVHGLARTPLSMLPLERVLEENGYAVVNHGYASIFRSAAEAGGDLAARIRAEQAEGGYRRVHLVGHSLGTVLIRWVLAYDRPDGIGRAVLIAPPNRGSRVADRWEPLLGWLVEPLSDLSTDPASLTRRLALPRGVEIGVVAGAWDGKVSVRETRLPGSTDRVVVCAAHTFLMMRTDVQELTLRFLREGRFGGPEAGVLRDPRGCERSALF